MRPGDPLAVKGMFNALAPKYDLFNDLFSLGLHRLWKRELLSMLRPLPGEDWIDLCCGTGDLCFSLTKLVCPTGLVVGLDAAQETLERAKRRSSKKFSSSISWVQRDALNTGLSSNLFDGAVMAYGLRNLADPEGGLKELYRLLKPGGRAGVLDFTRMVEGSLGEKFQKFYLRKIVVPISAKIGFGSHFSYLEESLKIFPDGEAQKKLAIKSGFSETSYKTIAMGQMGILLLKA